FAPANNLARHLLVEAELARVRGQSERAPDLYRRAIETAREHGIVHEEAIALERLAGFWNGRGEADVARVYLARARHRYGQWGAAAKVRDLEAAHPGLAARTEASFTDGNLADSVTAGDDTSLR